MMYISGTSNLRAETINDRVISLEPCLFGCHDNEEKDKEYNGRHTIKELALYREQVYLYANYSINPRRD